MSDRCSVPVLISDRWGFRSAKDFLPSVFQDCIFATLIDANPRSFRRDRKRWLLAIFPCMRTATRPEKFLRCRFALLAIPAVGTRFGLSIGCEYAALTRKRK